jgi:membrane protein DedA with SNARE-associated domain/rhodanese-related sulfurtransferase
VVLAEALGLPVPAALGLLVAGAAAAHHTLSPLLALAAGLAAMLLGDNILFILGRVTGWWLLTTLCRFSLNPEACIYTSADTFHKKGRRILLFAKFFPGVNTMAPPLAGSMGMRWSQFFPLDLAGAAIYVSAYFGAGFLFSDFLSAMVRGYSSAGTLLGWLVAAAAAAWLANRVRLWLRSRNDAPVRLMTPEQVMAQPESVIFDVRTHGYYEEGTMRIQGSSRLEPNTLDEQLDRIPRDRQIVLYCTCLKEASAMRVARLLAERGFHSVVLHGGLGAWKRAGLPVEPVPAEDVVLLPRFS